MKGIDSTGAALVHVPGWVDRWVDGWVDGWMDGSKSGFKDCLQQSTKCLNTRMIQERTKLSMNKMTVY
jgi:hypothetical protein